MARWAGVAASAALVIALGGAGVLRNTRSIRDRSSCDRSRPYQSPACFDRVEFAFLQTVADAATLTPSDAILLTPKGATVFHLTGRRSVSERYAASLGAPELNRYLREIGADYAVVSQVHTEQATIAARLLPYCREWQLIGTRGTGTAILLRRTDSTTAPSSCEALTATSFRRPRPDP